MPFSFAALQKYNHIVCNPQIVKKPLLDCGGFLFYSRPAHRSTIKEKGN